MSYRQYISMEQQQLAVDSIKKRIFICLTPPVNNLHSAIKNAKLDILARWAPIYDLAP